LVTVLGAIIAGLAAGLEAAPPGEHPRAAERVDIRLARMTEHPGLSEEQFVELDQLRRRRGCPGDGTEDPNL
jgi:hypothetical protein